MRIGICFHATEAVAAVVSDSGETRLDSCSIELRRIPESLSVAISRFIEFAHSTDEGTSTEPVTSVTFGVAAVLAQTVTKSTTFVRIAPRAPLDQIHEYPAQSLPGETYKILHVQGGHSDVSEELSPLDVHSLRAWCETRPPDERYVITAVGATTDNSHEQLAGEVIRQFSSTDQIEYSHFFHCESVEVREQTAAVNGSLKSSAEKIVEIIQQALSKNLSKARQFVTTNDGGRHPLSRLPLLPIDSLYAEPSMQLVGAASQIGKSDGLISVTSGSRSVSCHFVNGFPCLNPRLRTSTGNTLATSIVNLVPISEVGSPHDKTQRNIDLISGNPHLCALGAISAPLSDRAFRVVPNASESVVKKAIRELESRTRTRLISFGALGSRIEYIESGVEAATYNSPSTVSIRVHAMAPESLKGHI